MARVMFLGGEETGNVAYCDWGRFRFHIHKWVECDDQQILRKAAANRFFRVYGGTAAHPSVEHYKTMSGDAKDASLEAPASEVPPQIQKRRGRPPKARTEGE